MSENTTSTYKKSILDNAKKATSTVFRAAVKPVRLLTNLVQAANPFETLNSDNNDNWGVSADVKYFGEGDYTDEENNNHVLEVYEQFSISNNTGVTTLKSRNCFESGGGGYKYVAKIPKWIPFSGEFVCVHLKEGVNGNPVINQNGRFTITNIKKSGGSRKYRRTRGKYRRTRGKSRRTRKYK